MHVLDMIVHRNSACLHVHINLECTCIKHAYTCIHTLLQLLVHAHAVHGLRSNIHIQMHHGIVGELNDGSSI